MLKKNSVHVKYVEEEIVIDVKFIDAGMKNDSRQWSSHVNSKC